MIYICTYLARDSGVLLCSPTSLLLSITPTQLQKHNVTYANTYQQYIPLFVSDTLNCVY